VPQNYICNSNEYNILGGGDVLIDIWLKQNIGELITSHLGERSPRAEYSFADAFLSLFISRCRDNNRIEHFKEAGESLKNHRRFKTAMSPDSYLYMSKELALPKQLIRIDTEVDTNAQRSNKERYQDHEIVVIDKLNELMVDAAIKFKLFDFENEYIMDFDTTEIKTKIKDARRYYDGNGKRAYCPAVAMINNIPVYIENRNGNTNASFNIVNTIKAALDLVSKKGIKIYMIRVDSAAFTKEFVEFINASNLKFITRAKSPTVQAQIHKIKNWEKTCFKNEIDSTGDTVFAYGKEKTRLIVRSKSKPTINKEGKETKDWGLATNDFESPNEDIINTYGLRGDSENLFSSLNDFGWDMLPMRKIEFNTVYLYFTAFNYIVYRFMTRLIGSELPSVNERMEIETFNKIFMRIATEWIGESLSFAKSKSEYAKLSGFT